MKIYFLFILFLLNSYCRAQTIAEWTEQGATQVKYLLEQIAAQKVYLDRVSKAYDIVQKGADVISDIKQKRFSIHSLYFNSLSLINPRLAGGDCVKDILSKEKKTVQNFLYAQQLIRSSLFSDALRNYVLQVSDNAIIEVSKLTDALIEVFEPSKLNMTDEERMKRVNASASDANAILLFSTSIVQQVRTLSDEKKQLSKQIAHSLQLSGIEK